MEDDGIKERVMIVMVMIMKGDDNGNDKEMIIMVMEML